MSNAARTRWCRMTTCIARQQNTCAAPERCELITAVEMTPRVHANTLLKQSGVSWSSLAAELMRGRACETVSWRRERACKEVRSKAASTLRNSGKTASTARQCISQGCPGFLYGQMCYNE
jgi:hypothetical protein